MLFDIIILVVAAVAGAVASVAGFGIGSLLTPVLAWRAGTKLAIAIVAIPHFLGTAFRLWMLRAHVDRNVLWSFGIASAVCGLLGALAHDVLGGPVLARVFGGLLILAGISSVTGLMQRLDLGRKTAFAAGALSGFFGGLVGNQGSIRSAALLGFRVTRDAFVATATAIALMVDAARVPVYLAVEGRRVLAEWPLIALATIGVLAGTVAGGRILRRIPERLYRRVVSALVLALGVWMLLAQRRG